MLAVDHKTTTRFQLVWTFITLLVTYLLFAGVDIEDLHLIYELLFIIFEPIVAVTVSITTILICFIVGLPIRLIEKINNWWIKKPVIQMSVLAVGSLLILLSTNSIFARMVIVEKDGAEVMMLKPNYHLAISGWFITAFSMLHFYPHEIAMSIKTKIFISGSVTSSVFSACEEKQ